MESKKARIVEIFNHETQDITEIANRVGARPSYVAQVLQNAGLIDKYFDLYTHTTQEQNVYSRAFRNVLSFKSAEAAQASVQRIDELYRHYERLRDRAGQHQAMVIALTGLNRARWSGKLDAAKVFSDWLSNRIRIEVLRAVA